MSSAYPIAHSIGNQDALAFANVLVESARAHFHPAGWAFSANPMLGRLATANDKGNYPDFDPLDGLRWHAFSREFCFRRQAEQLAHFLRMRIP